MSPVKFHPCSLFSSPFFSSFSVFSFSFSFSSLSFSLNPFLLYIKKYNMTTFICSRPLYPIHLRFSCPPICKSLSTVSPSHAIPFPLFLFVIP